MGKNMKSMKKGLATILAAGALAFSGNSLGDETNTFIKSIRNIGTNWVNITFLAPADTNKVNGYVVVRSQDLLSGFVEGVNYAGEILINPTNKTTSVDVYEPRNDNGTNYFYFDVKKIEHGNQE